MNIISNILTNTVTQPAPEHLDEVAAMYAPLHHYVPGVMKLMLNHTWQQMQRSGIAPSEALKSNAWICRLLTLDKRVLNSDHANNIPGWHRLHERLLTLLTAAATETQLSMMSEELLTDIRPILEARFITDYKFPVRTFHCWWYTMHDDNTHVALHLVNAYQPDSPFGHLRHFVSTMLQAVQHARDEHPDITIVSCGSWLNALPKFQQLWPENFSQNQRVLNDQGGFGPGAWGQYMKTNGEFNHDRAETLNKTGKHPYPLTEARTGVNELISHLSNLLVRH